MSIMRLVVGFGLVGGVGIGVSNDLVPGVNQSYEYCDRTVKAPEDSQLKEVEGTVLQVERRHPCLGREAFVVVRLDVQDGDTSVVLGPESLVEEIGLHFLPGDRFSGLIVPGAGIATAVEIRLDADVVDLWDESGRARRDETIAH